VRVQDVKTQTVIEVNDGYGARLIEQGFAVPYHDAPAAAGTKAKRKTEAVHAAERQD